MGRSRKKKSKDKCAGSLLNKIKKNNESNVKESSNSVILDIYSRLELSLEPNVIDSTTESADEDEEGLEFYFKPRFIYVNNLCLVCMNLCNSPSGLNDGIKCPGCKMIYYCSEKHRKQNETQHKTLCYALNNIYNDKLNGFASLFRMNINILSPDAYRLFRMKTIELTENIISRKLDLWEREILLYPRICRICKKINDNLIVCPNCGIDFYCQDHDINNHEKWCKQFQIFRKIVWTQHNYGHINPHLPNVYFKKPYQLISHNFDSFMYDIYKNNPNYKKIDSYTYAILSHLMTIPLTTLFSIQKSINNWEFLEEFNIHIIGAEFQFECSSLQVWEKLFLHLLPKLKRLNLVFIGPELYLPQSIPIKLLEKINICKTCKSFNRIINVSFHQQQLYHQIDENTIIKPDLICLFNPGLYRETGFCGSDSWPKTIKKFCQTKIPVVITSYTEYEIPIDIKRIESICTIEVLLKPQINPFGAVKPERNFVSDDIAPLMYKNYCISIVKGL